ncbi:MAG: hypothetical protein JW839_01440, partial [Candidatus Lokiarchaeota archaeon]|nr:hypothetical protein [Candidatus Lokiarchaeota archaeon]
MVKRWKFKFAEVEIYQRKIVVSSYVNYKQLEKDYKDQVKGVSDEIKSTLNDLFEKKRLREADVNPDQQNALVDLFNSIAVVDGIQVVEEAEPEPAPAKAEEAPRRAAASSSTAGQSKYKVSIVEALDFKTEYDGKITGSSVSGTVSVVN